MAVSNNITACVNFLALVCAVPVVATGIWAPRRIPLRHGRSHHDPPGIPHLLLRRHPRLRRLPRPRSATPTTTTASTATRRGCATTVSGDPRQWEGIRACLAASDTCRKLSLEAVFFITPEQFYQSHLTPLPSGCCKPPTVCGYAYVSPTVWVNPANPAADGDCAAWGNDPWQLCYGCSSCKAGMLGTLRE
ncbi:hypothetical protein ABZP36_012746 [Zizania latifolia]